MELVVWTLHDFMNVDLTLAGIVMLSGGDINQPLPIKLNTHSTLINLSTKFISLRNQFSKFSLTVNMRSLAGDCLLANGAFS